MNHNDIYNKEQIKLLENCTLCHRECKVNRFGNLLGFCKTDAGMNIASICIHKGEEPEIIGEKGICNIFFSGCNLRCIYCQNSDISRIPSNSFHNTYSYGEALDTIENILSQGVKSIGFVSPSHVVPQVKTIIAGLHSRGLNPITIYNTNSYEKEDTIRSLEGLIDIYLPDFKYASSSVAQELSGASDYPTVALKAVKAMYFQKGSTLITNDSNQAVNGLIVRHLVLPGFVEESKKALRILAEEISPGIHLSLMSQYFPVDSVKHHPLLSRTLSEEEYMEVVDEMDSLGFRNGRIQEMNSSMNYIPDFNKQNPFEQQC